MKKNNKVNKDLLKEYISFVPKDYKFENETAKKVFAVLYFYSNLNNHQPFTIGQRQIADETMLSQMTVSRAMKILMEKYKYVACQKGHLKVNSTYQILSPVIETSMIKNDTFQKDPMFQQNVSIKMIDDVSINTTDIEEVTDVEDSQMFQYQNTSDDLGQMFHKYNNNNKFNNKHNNNTNMINNKENSTYSNNYINLKEMELIGKLLERIEVLESNQNKTTLLIENLFNNFTTSIESKEISKLTEKVLQLEEKLEKKNTEITQLNERLDKAANLFIQLRNSVTCTPKLEVRKENSTNTTSNIENSKNNTNNTNNSISTTLSGKTEYIQAIDKFYKSKNSKNFEQAEEALNTLNSLVEEGKLNDYQIEKVSDCKKYFEEEKTKGTTNTTNIDNNNFYTLQNNFYKTLNGKEEDKFDSLTATLKNLEELKLSDSKQKENLKKIEEIYVKTLSDKVRVYYFKEFIAYRHAFQVLNAKCEKENMYKLSVRFCDYLNSLKNVSKTILKGAKLENAVNYENGLWDNDITSFKKEYEKKAPLSLQNVEDGTTAHINQENRPENLKSGKNEDLTNINTIEVSETEVEKPKTLNVEVKQDYSVKAPVSLQNVQIGTTDHVEEENSSESLKSGKNKILTNVIDNSFVDLAGYEDEESYAKAVIDSIFDEVSKS